MEREVDLMPEPHNINCNCTDCGRLRFAIKVSGTTLHDYDEKGFCRKCKGSAYWIVRYNVPCIVAPKNVPVCTEPFIVNSEA